MTNKFWIVWSPEGKTAPQKRYSTPTQASGVAADMAKKFPGQTFFALETMAGYLAQTTFSSILERTPVTPVRPHPGPPVAAVTPEPPKSAATSQPPQARRLYAVGDMYRSQKGQSPVLETRFVQGEHVIVVYRAEDRPLDWQKAKWAHDVRDFWTPEAVRGADPLNAFGRTPQPFSFPAVYVL